MGELYIYIYIFFFIYLLPKKRMIRRTVTIQSAKMTLKATPMLMPSMSMGWKSKARS